MGNGPVAKRFRVVLVGSALLVEDQETHPDLDARAIPLKQ
jgi:hypothetical protein